MTPIRVLHAPEMVAGNAPELARAERRIGLRSYTESTSADGVSLTAEVDLDGVACTLKELDGHAHR